jgi:hypothetical protein
MTHLEIQETPTRTRPALAVPLLTSSIILSDSDDPVLSSENETELQSSLTLPSIIADSDWIESSDADSLPEEAGDDLTPPPVQMQFNQDLFDSHQGRFSSNNDHIPNLHGELAKLDYSLNSTRN